MINQFKKVLVIAYVFPPIAYVGTYRTLRFCRYLPEDGWLPIVITIERGDDLENDDSLLLQIPTEIEVYRTKTIDFWRRWNRKKNVSNIRSGQQRTNEQLFDPSVCQKVRLPWLRRIKTFVSELVTTPDHMVFWVPFAVAKGISLLLHNDIKAIYTSSPPHSEHIAGLILSKLFHKPWVVDFRDPMLDSSYFTPPRLLSKINQALEKLFIHHANKVLIISNHYRMIMEKRYPLSAHKFVTMPNAYDPYDFENVKPETFDKFTIIYAGSFYANRSPQFFLKGFGNWYRDQPHEIQKEVQVIFYGGVSKELLGVIQQEGLETVVLTPGLVPKEKLIPKLKGADLLLLIIGFDPESRGTVTSKIFEYMACRRPILALIPEGDAADILKHHDQTYMVTSEDIGLLQEYLSKSYRAYTTNKKYKMIPKEDAEIQDLTSDMYDARYQTKRLAQCFNSIIGPEN